MTTNQFVPLLTAENKYVPANPYVERCGRYEFFGRLDDATQFCTVYDAETGRPAGTLSRRRVIERTGPVWTLYNLNGEVLRKWFFAPTYSALARGTVLKLNRQNGGR